MRGQHFISASYDALMRSLSLPSLCSLFLDPLLLVNLSLLLMGLFSVYSFDHLDLNMVFLHLFIHNKTQQNFPLSRSFAGLYLCLQTISSSLHSCFALYWFWFEFQFMMLRLYICIKSSCLFFLNRFISALFVCF